ncbi:hypothetical protein V3851_17070 [Paenibacillus sp. M1]|uniref:Uncharacterized protein n=2 Tax=Paenibacillus haidiansis TaxID=1574488 RepID=A0ABU7VV09_9BACL
MMKALLLLLGLLSPLAGEMQAAIDLPTEPAAQPALWRIPAPAQTPEEQKAPPLRSFDSMGDISLSDNLESVLNKKGKPDAVEKDPYTGFTECRYGKLTVGLYEGVVYYVHTGSSPDKIILNGISIPLDKFWLRHFLGEPDYVAEDGDVYMRGNAALKIYRDPLSGKITGADLFDEAAS